MTRHESLPELLEAVPNTEGRQSSYEEMRGFQMSARVEAAISTYFDEVSECSYETAFVLALEAADSVMFSEAAIERAAKLLCAANNLGLDYWESYHEDSLIKEKFRDQVRAVVAALREGA